MTVVRVDWPGIARVALRHVLTCAALTLSRTEGVFLPAVLLLAGSGARLTTLLAHLSGPFLNATLSALLALSILTLLILLTLPLSALLLLLPLLTLLPLLALSILPLLILLLTSRASHEMVQKSAVAGIELVAAISGATGLAARLAAACNLTLVGFTRTGRHVVYACPARLEPS